LLIPPAHVRRRTFAGAGKGLQMTDRFADLDAALERVVAAARAHLAAVKAAEGEPDDDAVWSAYVSLNNTSHEYDEQLNDVFGEVTPWDLEAISAEEAEGRIGTVVSADDGSPSMADDPHPHVVSVRQRRDYRVPSVSALLHSAETARPPAPDDESVEPLTTVAEAILELLQSGDGSLGMLDVPELDPLDGVVIVTEVAQPLNPEAHAEADGEAPFRLDSDDRTVGRLDEKTLVELDE
jgi:hypothetical protein